MRNLTSRSTGQMLRLLSLVLVLTLLGGILAACGAPAAAPDAGGDAAGDGRGGAAWQGGKLVPWRRRFAAAGARLAAHGLQLRVLVPWFDRRH